jgi:tetratricopeptide (TPR) repeat protein
LNSTPRNRSGWASPPKPGLEPKGSLGLGLALALVGLLAFALYFPTLKYDFVWDDQELIVNNERLATATAADLFGSRFMPSNLDSSAVHSPYYRPLATLSFVVDRRLFGLNSRDYHLHSMLLNALVSVLFALLAYLLFHSSWAMILAGIVFALHPAHAESVAFISGRSDVLMTLFALVALIGALVRSRWKRGHPSEGCPLFLVLTVPAYFLSLLAKETSYLLPLVVLVLAVTKGDLRSSRSLLIGLAVAAVVYLALRAVALKGTPTTVTVLPVWQYPVMVLNVLGTYLAILVFPFGYHVLVQQSPAIGVPSVFTLLGSAVIFIPLLLLPLLQRLRSGAWLGYCLMIGSLLPVTNVISLGVAYAAERLAYLPSAGIILLVAALLHELIARKPALRVPVVAVLGLYIVALPWSLYSRLPTWRNQLTLFRAMVQDQPNSAYAQKNLGIVFLDDLHQPDSAVGHFRATIAIAPANADAHANLARALLARGDTNGAIIAYRQAVILDPSDFESHNNLGKLWGQHGGLDSAVAQLQQAVGLRPARSEAHSNLGIAFALQGRTGEALAELRQAFRLNPDLPDVAGNLGTLLGQLGQRDSVRYYADLARRLSARMPPEQRP